MGRGRLLRIVLAGGLAAGLAACTSGPVTVPNDAVLYEVPRAGVASSRMPASQVPAASPFALPVVAPEASARDDFVGRIEGVLAEPGAGAAQAPVAGVTPVTVSAGVVPPGASATPLDDDRLNLNLYTLEQQRIDAAIAERELAAARSQLVIVEPGAVPQTVEGVNIALYAQQTTNRVGERRFNRPGFAFGSSSANCRRFASPDQAQRVFLSAGGPERDPYNLDPDGDGFACNWDPEPFRRLRM